MTIMDENGFERLQDKYSGLWNNYSYRSDVKYCLSRIYEYDIRMANVSMLRAAGYLPEKYLDKLAALPKQVRERTIGLMIRSDKTKTIDHIIKRGIKRARYWLFRMNCLQDHEILSIKNDAVFVIGRKLKYTKFGPIEFVLKNTFSGYHWINGLEFYYKKKTSEFTVKGLSDDILAEPDHKNGMLRFLGKVMDYLLMDRTQDLRKYLIQFSNDYKSRRLPYQYYRELNAFNIYRNNQIIQYKDQTNKHTLSFNYLQVNDAMIPELNINFNYLFYVLTIIRIHL